MAELINVTQTLSSLEVAEMVEMEHKYLMRNIRKYSNDMIGVEDGAKISPSDFWIEDSYLNSQNKLQPCYQITKLGCEFIAHKTTGAKGTSFTAKYIVRFHQMEEALKTGNMIAEQSSPELPMQSNTPVPLRKRGLWYYDNREAIEFVCEELNMSHSELYHYILHFLGRKYDLNAAKKLYKKERGYAPEMPMDIVDHFVELNKMATEILDNYCRIATT